MAKFVAIERNSGVGITDSRVRAEFIQLGSLVQEERFPSPWGTLTSLDWVRPNDATIDVIVALRASDLSVPDLPHLIRVGDRFMTGRVPLTSVRVLEAHPNVARVNRSTPISRAVDTETVRAISRPRTLVPKPSQGTRGKPLTGAGVLIGVIDTDFSFLSTRFRGADGKSSRVRTVWDQRGGATGASPSPYKYGRLITQGDIEAVIGASNPSDDDLLAGYADRRIGYSLGEELHGTSVTDIAAGSSVTGATGPVGDAGIAPEAELVLVHLRPEDEESPNPISSSRFLLDAIDFVHQYAKRLEKPLVVNISLSGGTGPHDGTTPVESYIDELSRLPGRAFVLSAGNLGAAPLQSTGIVSRGASYAVGWKIPPNRERDGADTMSHEIEIWYDSSIAELLLSLSVVDPSTKEEREILRLGELATAYSLTLVAGESRKVEVLGVVVRTPSGVPGRPGHAYARIDAPRGFAGSLLVWRARLSEASTSPAPTTESVALHAWIERRNLAQSTFCDETGGPQVGERRNRPYSISNLATGFESISVGNFDHRSGDGDTNHLSANGPTRDQRAKPDLCAPGINVVAINRIRLPQGESEDVWAFSGTSASAPIVTGVVALLFELLRPNATSGAAIRRLLCDSCTPTMSDALRMRFGHGAGLVQATGAVDRVRGSSNDSGEST